MDLPESDPPRRLADDLPADATRFVGRSNELKQLVRLLTRERLVTLTGVGGAGKTRLAIQAANRVRGSFPDGIAYVSLADLHDDELLCELVGDALGFRGSVHRWNAHTLVDYLTDSHRLLVLDNCEHLVGACAHLIDELLIACPRVSILATSREPIAVVGENVFPTLPLEVPAADCPFDGLAQYDAVRLFVERAVSVLPSFKLTEANHQAVAELCRMLDGIPLAVELAAVRLRALSLEQLAELLAGRPDLLDSGRRGGPARQRTLSASMSWSYDICSVPEQLLWGRVSVFSGGVELSAAEGICADDRIPADQILPLLTSLVDKSILIREEGCGRVRYRLLETIRQFGLNKLGDDGADVTHWRRRHRDWYLAVVKRAMLDWSAPGLAESQELLRADIANLRAALEFCLAEPGEAASGLQMASALYQYWMMSGLLAEGSYWTERLLDAVPEPCPVRIHGLYAAASLCILRRELDAGARMLDEADQMVDADATGRAYVVQAQGLLALMRDNTEQAAALLERALGQFEAADDQAGSAITLVLYAIVSMLRGESDQVTEAHRRCRELTVPYGETWAWSSSLWAAGMDAWNRGELAEASELLRAALDLKRPLRDHIGIAEAIEGIAWVAAGDGKLERAAVLLGAADRIWHGMGMSVDTVPGFNRHRDHSAKLARRLGERPFQAAHRRGNQMTLDESMAFALDESVPSGGSDGIAKPTKRERQIADLIALGYSNQDIADELVLSRRTVEAHVQHVMAKLGFNNRTQVAAWVAHQNAVGG
ncbi:LuxR C-terminal-related transcriptional regulator [Mycolicibacterium fortuitum]|uniref:LuxR C-terminal-related transcriptional regulator n=1 Tax=Mycolicibacterium fortuitum TaxID=1766 RepID=UPI001CDC17EA|nr:LuxR C-terminal-related transcriptional regulator [Mycolicibacterium fortuitum]UBV14721.1 LuxR family transcriptional regulator [Mycolicibacterium fortuitum]